MHNNIKLAYTYSINNKPELVKKQKCGCFYCLKIFNSSEIIQWIEDTKGTAVCPYCGVDSVLGEYAGFPLTKEFLSDMYNYYF